MKRDPSLDFVKTVALFLVFFIHTIEMLPFFPRTWWSNLFSLLIITSVPLFLMVNGALLLNRPFDRQKWQRRTVNLIALTLLWKLLLVLFCHFFWRAGEGVLTVRTVLEYLLGGDEPYGQLGYTWFLDMYVSIQILFPIWKLLYDHHDRAYLKLLLAVILVGLIGVDTLVMVLRPIAILTGREALPYAFSHLAMYTPFAVYAMYLVYFFLGGLIYRACSSSTEKADRFTRFVNNKRAVYAAGVIAYIICYAFNRFEAQYMGGGFSLILGYTNLFTVVLAAALFTYFISRSYPAWMERLATFIGKRTFGIYIMEVAPLRAMDILIGGSGILNALVFTSGQPTPSVCAMLWPLPFMTVSFLLSALVIAGWERIPGLKRLLLH